MNEPRRIDQTEFGPKGNCQSACLAMLLGFDLSEIPNFTLVPGADKDDAASFFAQRAWLNERGWNLLTIPAAGIMFQRHFAVGFVIAGGESPRGLAHSVIYKDGALWHDPHPSRAGLVQVIEVDVLYPLRPFERAV